MTHLERLAALTLAAYATACLAKIADVLDANRRDAQHETVPPMPVEIVTFGPFERPRVVR